MSLTSENYKEEFAATGGTVYNVTDFRIWESEDEEVVHVTTAGVETTLTPTTSYAISNIASTGFTVTTVDTYSSGTIVVRRNQPKTQDADWERNGALSTPVLEKQLDKIVAMIQSNAEELSRSLLQAATADSAIVFPVASANALIGWNSGGTGLENANNPAVAAAASAAAASLSETAAELAETHAKTAETNAETAETNAGNSATDAAASAASAPSYTRATFDDGDLSTGNLTITHGLSLSAPYTINVEVFDNNNNMIIPDEITGAANSVVIDLTSYGTLTGTWGYGLPSPTISANTMQTVFDAGQAITIADTDNQTLKLTQNDTTNNPIGMEIENAGTGDGLFIDQNGNGTSLNIDSEATSATVVNITNAGTGASIQAEGNINWDASNMNPTNLLSNGDFEAWSAGTSSAPDGWTKIGTGALVAREDTIIKLGTYSAKLSRVGANNTYMLQDPSAEKGLDYWKGRVATIGCWVFCDTSSSARLNLNDGPSNTYSSYHTGDSTWQWLSLTHTVSLSATRLQNRNYVDADDTSAYFDGAMLVEGASAFAFSPKPLDENSEIKETLGLTAGESLVSGDLCYFKSDGKMWKSDADAVATSKGLIAICLDTISADATGTFLIKGKYTTSGLTTGDELYISTTAGDWTNTAPTATADIVRVIGYALSNTVLYFDVDKSYLEVS